MRNHLINWVLLLHGLEFETLARVLIFRESFACPCLHNSITFFTEGWEICTRSHSLRKSIKQVYSRVLPCVLLLGESEESWPEMIAAPDQGCAWLVQASLAMCLCGELYVPVSLCYTVCALVSGASLLLDTSLSEQNLFKTKLAAAFCTRCTFFWRKAGRGYVTVSLKCSFESTRLWARDRLLGFLWSHNFYPAQSSECLVTWWNDVINMICPG